MKKYFFMEQSGTNASITIYGDITSWEWMESDVSSYTLSKLIETLDVGTIDVYINSRGGEVAEGLAIYSALRRHKAKIVTHDDGFACSAASVVFMAGDERIMSPVSLLMIHNAWAYAAGNANELRKQADDLDTISKAAANAYLQAVSITEEELYSMLDAETWIPPQDALDMGFATAISADSGGKVPSQSVRRLVFDTLTNGKPPQSIEPPKENIPLKLLSALTRRKEYTQ